MKKLGVEDGKLVLYLQKRDVEILSTIKENVRSSFFEEESIVKDECEDEYYKITNPDNMDYIKKLSFIPSYERLYVMDVCDLCVLENMHSSVLQKLTCLPKHLDSDEEEGTNYDFLNSVKTIDQSLVSKLDSVKSNKEYRRIVYILKQQVRCYNYSVRQMINYKIKKQEEEEAKRREENKFSVKKMIKKIRKKNPVDEEK